MLPWVRHLLLLLVAHTISSNKIDKGLNLLEYYEKNKEVSPLEILLQDDKFLRKNAEKHGYINGEWAGLLADSTTATPCGKNPRLNNPDCIKNEKHSYFSSLEESRNTQKYEDKYNYDRPRVSPALAHTERYILGKRKKENFRHQELDTTDNRNVIATEIETETQAQKVDDKQQQQTEHRITKTEFPESTANTLENDDEINYLSIEQNTSLHELHEVQPSNITKTLLKHMDHQRELAQEESFYQPTQLENGQPNRVTNHGSWSQPERDLTLFEYPQNSKLTPNSESNLQDLHYQKNAQLINGSLRDSIPKEKQTSQALLDRINKKLPGQDTQTSRRNSQSHETPELNGNASFAGKGNVNIYNSSENVYLPNSTEPLTHEQYGRIGTTANRNLENLGKVSSDHDSISGSGRTLKKTDLEKAEIVRALENKINGEGLGEPTHGDHVNVTSSTKGNIPSNSAHVAPENETNPYGRVDINSVSSAANDSQRNDHSNNMFTDELKGTDKNLINETSTDTHSNINESYVLTARALNDSEINNANSSYTEKLNDLPTESTHTDADPYGRVDSASINSNDSSQKHKVISFATEPTCDELTEVGPDRLVDSFNVSSNNTNRNDNTPSRTEQPQNENISQIERPKSESIHPYDAGNKLVKGLVYPSSVNGVIDSVVQSRQNKTPAFQKSVFRGKTPETNVQSEVGPYGLVEPKGLNIQNHTGEGIFFIPANNGSFSSRNQQFQKPDASETTHKTHTPNVTVPYSRTDLTSENVNNTPRENGVIPSQLPPDNGVQVDSNKTLVLQKQNETDDYGLVDSATISSNYDNRESSFSPVTRKPFSDTQLYQAIESKTYSNTELGPYGLVDSASVSRNLKPEDTRNTSSGVNASFIQYPDHKNNNSLNLNPQNISILQQNTSRNETFNPKKDTLQNGEKIGPYGFDVETPKSERTSNNSENNEDKLSQGEVNPTSGAAEPTFKILHHAIVGNYSSTQPKIIEDTVPKKTEINSKNGKDIMPSSDGDKKHSTGLIKNNSSKTENADGQFTPDSNNERTSVIPNNYTTADAQLNRSLLILECPVQLCYCDSGKPVTGFRLIPF